MSDLTSQLQGALDFLANYPKLETSGDLRRPVEMLASALTKFLCKADQLKLEQMPGYAEVASLLEGDGKQIANLGFMKDFCKNKLRLRFQEAKANKGTRRKFLDEVARHGKLAELKESLEPHKRFKDLLIEIIKADLTTIERRLGEMKPKELTGLVDANGFTAPKTSTGVVSRSKKSIAQIMLQIEQIKQSEYL